MQTVERSAVPQHLAGGPQGPPATPPQKKFIMDLLEQKDLSVSDKFAEAIKGLNEEELAQFMANMRERVEALTKKQAGEWIDRLKELPRKKVEREADSAPEVPAGHYALEYEDDELNPIRFYVVQHGKDNRAKGGQDWTGYIFVKRYSSDDTFPVKGKARYEVLRRIAEDPLRAAQLYGQHYERCCICNRRLTRRLSRELGIGPVCGRRNEWIDDAMVERARAAIESRGENPDEEVA